MIVLLRHMTSNNSSSYLISGTCYMQYWAAYSWPFTRSESPSMIMEWWLMSVLDRIMARCGPQSTHLVSPHCFIAVATLNIRKKLAFMIWIFLLPSTHELIQNLKRIVYCQTIGNPGHHNGIRPRVHLADLEQGLVPQSRPLAYSRPSSSFSAASPQCPRRCCHSSISAGLLPLICPFYVSNRCWLLNLSANVSLARGASYSRVSAAESGRVWSLLATFWFSTARRSVWSVGADDAAQAAPTSASGAARAFWCRSPSAACRSSHSEECPCLSPSRPLHGTQNLNENFF